MAKNTEIERKFLVTSEIFRTQAVAQHEIEQGYLCKDPERTIRVRICDQRAFLTIKSNRISEGIAHFEWEKEIELSDARELLTLCIQPHLHKTRYIIPASKVGESAIEERKWEVDVFHGHKEGLILAELELGREDEPFVRPKWLGEEVTYLPEYHNANM